MGTPLKNFSEGIVSGTYDAAATSVTLSTGHGSRFAAPATEGAFNAWWWNATDYPNPAQDPDKEIIRVLVRTGDTFGTILRGQEGTAASDKNIAGKEYRIAAGITAAVAEEFRNISLSQTFRNLTLSTHHDSDLAPSRIVLNADAIVMNDGEEVTGWANVIADLTASGVGGLDTGSEANGVIYKIFALYNGTTKGLCFHRDKDWLLDADSSSGEDATQGIRSNVDNSTVRVSQGFQVSQAGPMPFHDVKLIKVGAPTGNLWFTLEGNNAGVPNNTVLATSRKIDVSRLSTTASWIRNFFPTPAALSTATQYHRVAHGDWAISGTNYVGWRMDGSAGTYANGTKALYDSDTLTWTADADDDLMFRGYIEQNDVAFSTTVPAGYRYAHVGYAINNSAGNLIPFIQRGRKWRLRNAGVDGIIVNETASGLSLVDVRAFVPALESLTVLLGLTGTGAAAATASLGSLDATDLANAALPGLQAALYAGGTAEWPYSGFSPVDVEYAGLMIAPTAGADLYYGGFIW